MDPIRRRLLTAAAELLEAPAEELTVIVARTAQVVHPEPPPLPPVQPPAGLSEYDLAILRAATPRPCYSHHLARRCGRRLNSYFRERVSLFVEQGHLRRTRRGISRPG